MRIAVFGLGYVGCVSLACLAEYGHLVFGVDINEFKVNQINSGKPTIIEKDIDELIKKHTDTSQIIATTDHLRAIRETDIAFICVGTPSTATGQLNLKHIFETAKQIGNGIKERDSFYTIVIRSTVMPGTNHSFGIQLEEVSGGKRNEKFAIVSNPEFLREGSAVADFFNPALTIIGTENSEAFKLMENIYEPTKAPIVQSDIGLAEIIKYVNNSFHALKIAFANEIGVISKTLGINSIYLMELFAMDTKLNISSAYLTPGMAYGGSCLTKDLKGLYTIAYDHYLETPLLKSIGESNYIHSNRAFELVEKYKSKKIGIIGLAFKKGTDDLRYSPAVDLVEKLNGKGYNIKIYDPNVILSKLLGANKSYIEKHLPHVSTMLDESIYGVLNHGETLVLVHKIDDILAHKSLLSSKNIIDLAGHRELMHLENYEGIAW